MNLTQIEFYEIITSKKYIEKEIITGGFGKQKYQIFFEDEYLNSFNLYLDIFTSGSIEIKHTINKRAKKTIPIIRLDIQGHHHSNPEFNDDFIPKELEPKIIELMKKYSNYKFTKENHLHYFIEPYRDKWAFPPTEIGLKISKDFTENIRNFCNNFNIKATIKKEGLFWEI